jgi:hypothetical protein
MLFDIVRSVDTPSVAVSLGQLELDISSSPQPGSPIKVEVEYREDGTVAGRVRDLQTRREFSQPFEQDNQAGLAHPAHQRALVRSTPVHGLL